MANQRRLSVVDAADQISAYVYGNILTLAAIVVLLKVVLTH